MKLLLLDDDTGSASRLIELLEESSLITKFDTGFPNEAASLLLPNYYDAVDLLVGRY